MAKKHHKHLDYDSYKKDYDAYLREQKQKKREPMMKVLRPLLIVALLVALGFGVYYVISHPEVLNPGTAIGGHQEETPAPEEEDPVSAEDEQEEAPVEGDAPAGESAAEPEEAEAEEPRVPVTLTAGEYVAGIDFPAGRYVLTTEEEECQFAKPGQKWTLRRGDNGYTCTFEDADQLNCAGKITLTPVEENIPEEENQ